LHIERDTRRHFLIQQNHLFDYQLVAGDESMNIAGLISIKGN
jgi:hypothetical protein